MIMDKLKKMHPTRMSKVSNVNKFQRGFCVVPVAQKTDRKPHE